MEGGCPVRRLVQGQTGGRDSVAAAGGAVMLELRHVSRPLLRLGKAVPCLSLRKRIKSFAKALLWSHGIVVVAH